MWIMIMLLYNLSYKYNNCVSRRIAVNKIAIINANFVIKSTDNFAVANIYG